MRLSSTRCERCAGSGDHQSGNNGGRLWFFTDARRRAPRNSGLMRCDCQSRKQCGCANASPARKIAGAILAAVQLALLIAAERDIHRRPASEVVGPKWRWRLICLINFIGAISYFRWGRKRAAA